MNTKKKKKVIVVKVNFKNKDLLNKIFEIRNEVFVVEQNVNANEEFEFEESSIHFLLFEEKIPCATARYRQTKNGIKLERFAVLKEHRKKGYGSKVLKRILKEFDDVGVNIYLHAQAKVVRFYEKHGFSKVGDMFSEANINHYKMVYS